MSLSYDRQTFSEKWLGQILARVVNCYPRKFHEALSRIAERGTLMVNFGVSQILPYKFRISHVPPKWLGVGNCNFH